MAIEPCQRTGHPDTRRHGRQEGWHRYAAPAFIAKQSENDNYPGVTIPWGNTALILFGRAAGRPSSIFSTASQACAQASPGRAPAACSWSSLGRRSTVASTIVPLASFIPLACSTNLRVSFRTRARSGSARRPSPFGHLMLHTPGGAIPLRRTDGDHSRGTLSSAVGTTCQMIHRSLPMPRAHANSPGSFLRRAEPCMSS